ncbi:MAG: SDR family oxidoreductase [Planctomycetes bacterium]|nr:SDR family oxidoreductase [Planctomycetota bacterium]
MDLKGRGAVVTGGGRGIGAAVGRALAEAGASVLLAARTTSEVEAIAAELSARGRRAAATRCDVTKAADVRALLRVAHREVGAIDILVNNAGIAMSAPVKSLPLADWNRVFAVNATGTFLCTQAVLPGMFARKWGRIVNVASVAGRTGGPYIAAYAASKHAVIGFTRCVAAEVAASGVTVNAVCPGYVDTELTRAAIDRIVAKTGRTREEALEGMVKTTPQRRLIGVDEVAYLVVSLCDERAGGINGQAIVLDGGGFLG